MKKLFVLIGIAAVVMIAADAQAFRVTTADPGGADCELRESSDSNRGDNTEIASRIASTRNSVIYLKFGVADITPTDLAGDITIQTTYRNDNIVASRIEDLAGGGDNTGFDYFILDPTLAGADWDEMTIKPSTAPGYNYDADMTTKATGSPIAPTTGLYYLGRNLFDSADLLAEDGKMPVGGAFNYTLPAGSLLHQAIELAQSTNHQTLTIVMGIAHEWDNPNGNWINFNYLFNPKEQDPLRNHAASPWGGMSNANGEFAPALTNVPEPATLALLCLGGMLLRRKR